MKNLVLFGIFVFLLVAIQFAGGQTVDEIIEKHIRARGGLNKINDIREMYMEGLITFMEVAIGIQIAKHRDELNPSGINMQWMAKDENGHTPEAFMETKLADEIIAGLQTMPDISEHLVSYAAKGYAAVLIGKEMVADNNCFHIKLNTKDQQEIHYWINTSSLMVQQSYVIKKSAAQADTGNYTTYADYKPVDGILMAHTLQIEKKAGNQGSICEIVFNKIQINQPFEPFIVKPAIQS
jgi:hypothetical protein